MSTYTEQHNVPPQIPLGKYLFHRLNQLNVTTIFGLPSEFNSPLLDQIYQIPSMRWCGNANELNASYAADGYSRIKRLSCLVTTFGVGEMSVLNGIAGSFSEHVAVLHVVGMPPSSAQLKKLLLHHTLGNSDYDIFHRLASDICVHTAVLKESDNICDVIDNCIVRCYNQQQPVYCGIPVNLAGHLVDSKSLDSPLHLMRGFNQPISDAVEELVDILLEKIYSAQHPVIVADGCASRHDCIEELTEIAQKTGFPLCCTPMGKGSFDEQSKRYVGVYMGSISSPQVREVVDFADFVLVAGALTADYATSSYHFCYKPKNIVLLFDKYAKVSGTKTYPDVRLKDVLQLLARCLDPTKLQYIQEEIPESSCLRVKPDANTPLRQEWMWARLSHWFRPGDVIVTEMGTSGLGVNQIKFPSGTKVVSQPLWGSLGYSVGACLGVLIAVQEESRGNRLKDNRIILFVGDGALQLTVQEISTIIKWGLAPYIFVINNQGYTIDRLLSRDTHHATADYYNIQPWNNLSIIPAFGGTNYDVRKVVKVGQLDQLLKDQRFSNQDILKMVEIILPSMDAPQALLENYVSSDIEHSTQPKRPKLA
ncbi:alpha-keto acid decarboxylase family protein Ecym_6055 [Eremothecium cymbalariae DBVPG|uniref:Pyruvate decarboxylase n=1 Tax=Eremothecium cymbalariae (strain CBS 270.75 / DBVPG 7215 / KCTC 17166 / NRRL Y-17582) TaxID=931890 RepID=G8JUX9_ERECY|nr:hypothetical protein Ecym_6055 [Eremothecium cymbalariae DBVPG\